jgi:hypothetical protein
VRIFIFFKEPPDEPVILSVEISASKPGLQLQPDYLLDLERKKHNIKLSIRRRKELRDV